MMIAVMTATPARAVAWTSIWRKRSSRPSPRSPRIVSLRPPSSNSAPTPAMIANEISPPCGSPPIDSAARVTAPRVTANTGSNHFDFATRVHVVLVRCIEHLLYSASEVAGEGERERQRGCVALLLDRVDRLAGDVDRSCQLALG